MNTTLHFLSSVYTYINEINLTNYISWSLVYVSIVFSILLVLTDKTTTASNLHYPNKDYDKVHKFFVNLRIKELQFLFYLNMGLIFLAMFMSLSGNIPYVSFITKIAYLVMSIFTIARTFILPLKMLKKAKENVQQ